MPNVNPPLKPVAPVSNTAPHPAATSLAGFIDAAHAQGFGNLDPNVLTAVASGGTNTPMTLPVLNNIKNAAASGWSSVGHFFADPNLSSPKTVAEKIAHHFINTGLPSATSEDVKSTQQILAYRGYAANLPIDGTWNGDWNNALNAMKQDEFKKTSAGNTGARNLFTELFTPMMWSHAIPLATSIVKNVGNVFADAGQNISDFAKMTTGTLSPEDKARIDSYGAFHYTSQAVDALSTYYLASSAVTGLSKTAFATKDAIAAGKTAGAKTSAGALAKVLPKESIQRPTTIMNSILPEIEGGARRLPFTKSLQNMPVTNYMNDLATGVYEGWQANRNLLATPYRLPIIKALGTAGSELGKLGFKAGAVGTGENFVGDKNGLQAQTLDNLTPIAGRVGNILDLLQVAMHPDLSAEGASLKAGVGAQVEASRKAMADGLNQTQSLANFERGTTLDSSKIIDALAKRGNVPNPKDIFDVHVANEINKLSAYHAGEGVWQNMVNKGLQDATDMDARQNVITSESHRIMSDPAALKEARNSYLLKPGVLAKDLAKNRTNILANYQKGQGGDIIDKLENDHWFRENFIPHADQLYDQVAQSLDYPEALKGKIGWANKDTVLAGDAQAQAVQFLNELEKARPGYVRPETMEPAKLDMMGQPVYENLSNAELPKSWDRANASPAEVKLQDQMVNYLGIEMNRDVRGLKYVSPENLALLIMKRSHYLAGELHLPSGASPELEQAFNVARTRGMRPVVGTDIGFQHHLDPKSLGWLGADQSRLAHAADKLGLDFQQIDPATRGQHTYAEMLNSIQTAMLDEKKFPSGSLPVWGQANHLVTFLHDVIPTDLNVIGQLAFKASSNKAIGRVLHPFSGSSWNDEIQKVIDASDKAITRTEAKSELLKQLSTEGGPQFWTRKQVIDALTTKGNEQGLVKNASGNLVEAAAMTDKAASDFYYAMQKGLRDAPAYLTGYNPFNKILDSTFGLAGIPIAVNGKRILDLTGSIRKTLLNARYLGSYRFAYLRSVKAALKGATANVPFTLDPAGELSRLSKADQELAKEIHAELFTPNAEKTAVTDYLNQEFARKDMFNVYNPLATETRNSLYLYKDALAKVGGDESKIDWAQMKKTSDNIINYGNQTAAEKSVNAFFFPFSFEKTVMRQLGGHLLDHAGTRLVVAAAVNAYNSDPQKVRDWMETNLPLFKELEKFNPFYHGVGVGQFGGINKLPYDVAKSLFVSMVAPQPVTNMNAAKAAVALIPAYRDLANILIGNDPNGKKATYWGGEALSTGKELGWIISNAVHNQNPSHAPFVPQDHLPPNAQISKAWNLRSQLLTGLTKALDVNRHGGDIKWPDSLPDGIKNQKINTSSINALINHIYPAWDNAKLVSAPAIRDAEIFRQRAYFDKTNPSWTVIFDGFIKASNSVQGQISKDSIDTAKLAQDTAALRTIAIALSKKEPSFYNFYRKFYQTKYGPLEMMK